MFDPNFMPEPHQEVRTDTHAFRRILKAEIRKHDPYGQELPLAIHVGESHGGRESLVVTLPHAVEHLQLEQVFRSYNRRRIFFIYTDAIDMNYELFNLLLMASLQGQKAKLIIWPSEEEEGELQGEFFLSEDEDSEGEDEEWQPRFSKN